MRKRDGSLLAGESRALPFSSSFSFTLRTRFFFSSISSFFLIFMMALLASKITQLQKPASAKLSSNSSSALLRRVRIDAFSSSSSLQPSTLPVRLSSLFDFRHKPSRPGNSIEKASDASSRVDRLVSTLCAATDVKREREKTIDTAYADGNHLRC